MIAVAGAGRGDARGFEDGLAVAASQTNAPPAVESHVHAGDHAAERLIGLRRIAIALERSPAAQCLRPYRVDLRRRRRSGQRRRLIERYSTRGGVSVARRFRRIGQHVARRSQWGAVGEVLPQPAGHGVAQIVRLIRQYACRVGMDRSVAEAGEGGARLGFGGAHHLLPQRIGGRRRIQRVGHRLLVARRGQFGECARAARRRQVGVEAIAAERKVEERKVGNAHRRARYPPGRRPWSGSCRSCPAGLALMRYWCRDQSRRSNFGYSRCPTP